VHAGAASRTAVVCLGLLALVTLGGRLAWAHHSLAGEFDTHKTLHLAGVVSRVDWVNPHIYVYLDVKQPDGTLATWHLECVPVAMARKGGISSKLLMGDGSPVTVDAFPARDGTAQLGFLAKITYADGHNYQFAQDGAPAVSVSK
jgi:hypothetical protein